MTDKDNWWHQMTDKDNWWQQLAGKKIDDTRWQVEITDESRWQVKTNDDIRWQIKATDDSRWSDLAVVIQTWWEVEHAGKGWVGQDQIEEGDCNLIERNISWCQIWTYTAFADIFIAEFSTFLTKKSLKLFRQYNFREVQLLWLGLLSFRINTFPLLLSS